METPKLKQSQKYVEPITNSDSKFKNDPRQIKQIEPIADTPFHLLKMDDKFYLTMGRYRLTPPMNTADEVLENAKDASWNRLLQIIQIMIEQNAQNAREEWQQEISKLNQTK